MKFGFETRYTIGAQDLEIDEKESFRKLYITRHFLYLPRLRKGKRYAHANIFYSSKRLLLLTSTISSSTFYSNEKKRPISMLIITQISFIICIRKKKKKEKNESSVIILIVECETRGERRTPSSAKQLTLQPRYLRYTRSCCHRGPLLEL